ncbi:MAG: hypothetical protein ACRCS9_08845 [Hyphomicrobium sp.]
MRLVRNWGRAALVAVEEQPILLVWVAAFLVGAVMNFNMGRELFGFEIGVAFAAIAILGAYSAALIPTSDAARRPFLIAATVAALCVGNWCGWQQMGLRMSRGLGELVGEAGQHNTAEQALKAARAERDKLGTQRPVDAVAAERAFECSRKGRQYPDGKGPKCTALISEEAAAQRAVDLDAQLPGLAQALADAPPTSDANALFSGPVRVFSAIGTFLSVAVGGAPVQFTNDDVIFGFSLFVVAVLTFFEICGPWMLGIVAPVLDPVVRPPPRQLRHMPEPREARTEHHPGQPGGLSPPEGVASAQRGGDGLHQPLAPPAASSFDGAADTRSVRRPLAPEQQTAARGGGHEAREASSNSLHGAPINLNVYTGSGPVQGPPQVAAPATSVVAERITDSNVQALRAVQREAFAPAAPDIPTDRSASRALWDGLLVYKAARLVHIGGGMVPASAMYDDYRAWSGPRAVDARAFHSAFEAATGVTLHVVGGEPHYSGVKIKEEAAIA